MATKEYITSKNSESTAILIAVIATIVISIAGIATFGTFVFALFNDNWAAFVIAVFTLLGAKLIKALAISYARAIRF